MFETIQEIAAQTEPIKVTLTEMGHLFCMFIPVGVLIGAFPLIFGLTISGVAKIFKQA